MRDNDDALAQAPWIAYYPYLEPSPGAGAGLLASLAKRAAVVVGDDFPSFFLPAQARAAGRAIPCRYELVDSNGLYPLRATDRVFTRAHDFRRQLHKSLAPHLSELPAPDPLQDQQLPSAAGLIEEFQEIWKPVSRADLEAPGHLIASLPIDHGVQPVDKEPGGSRAAQAALDRFLDRRLADYGELRNQPEEEAASELSAYLHWGHLSAHEVFAALAEREDWTPHRLADKPTGARAGWWGMSEAAEAFLDELITWREVGFNMTSRVRGLRPVRVAPRMGPRHASKSTRPTSASTSTHSTSSSRPARTTICGTPPSGSSSARAASTTTCECCGARRS